jgi:hypothetical protein
VEWPKGDPENAVTNQELRDKYVALATPVIGASKAAASFDALQKLTSLKSMRELSALLT